MKYYKDQGNRIFAFEEDGSQDHLIKDNFIKITENEVISLTTPIVTDEQKMNNISNAIQNMLDSKAIEMRYDNMMSVRSYCGFVSPYQEECILMSEWAASCWVKAGEIESDVLNGIRPIPTVEQVLLEMPTL